MDTEAFTEACALLPDSAAWGDPITPEWVLAIAEAAKDAERERCSKKAADIALFCGCVYGSKIEQDVCKYVSDQLKMAPL